MSLQPFSDKQLNYFKFASIVLNEFASALRQTFKSLWDNTFGHRLGYQLWDDSTAVRNLFLAEEAGKTKVPTHLSYEEWDCTALFQTTIYANSFATPDSTGHNRTLAELYLKHRKIPHGKFHASVVSPSGNQAETFTLAIDQLRLLRNSLCHSEKSEIDKPTFDQYMKLAKEAFQALGIKTDPIDTIGGLAESDFPTKKVRNLEQGINQELRARIEFLEGESSSMDELKALANAIKEKVESGASKEDLVLLKKKIDELQEEISKDQKDSKTLLSPSCLPPMVPHFTGRERECEDIVSRVASTSTRIVSIWGSPGFGKTSVATVVGYRLQDKELTVYFLSLRGLNSNTHLISKMFSFFRSSFTKDEIPQRLPIIEELFQVLAEISDEFVMILDNADDLLESGAPNVKENFVQFLQNILSRTKKATFVITTRESLEFIDVHFEGHQAVRIGPLDESFSQALVSKLLPGAVTASDCEEIGRVCGHVPLAIKLLCSSISEDNTKPSQFLEDCKESIERNIVEVFDNPDYPSNLRLKLLLESSFLRLSAQEKEVLVTLSTLSEDFNLSVAAAVMGVKTNFKAKKILHRLRRKSLLDSGSKPDSFSIQNQGPAREKDRRERERHDLRVLVGANLVRLSQLDGMTMDFYAETALPKILDHIVSVKDTLSQQYLLESMIQVFPDEFHIRTLEQVLSTYARALPSVDMKPIMVTLMNRLATYLSEADPAKVQQAGDIFSLFRTHLQGILERALQPQGQGGAAPVPDIAPALEVLAAFMQFTVSLYPDQVHYVDIILGSAAELLQKFKSTGLGTLSDKAVDQVGELLAGPMKTLGLGVLKMEHFVALVSFLNFETRKQTSLSMVTAIVEEDRPLSSLDDVKALFSFISPLVKDEADTPADEGKDKARFAEEQQMVCKLVHQIRHEDTDVEYQILTEMRGSFGQGGPQRLIFSLQPIFFGALGLVPKIQAREKRRAEEGDEVVPPPTISLKKVFQFLHRTNTALMQSSPDMALQLWLTAAVAADQVERATGAQGNFEPICYEFLTQALVLFEEEISDSSKQYKGIHAIVGTLCKIVALDPENFDTVSQKITRHAAKLLKKPMQCRAVSACSQLFWCDARRDAKRVRECLERCVKTCETVVQSDPSQTGLWVEMLDRYIYYFEVNCEEVDVDFLQRLLAICVEHINFALKDQQAEKDAKKAEDHLKSTVAYLRKMKETSPRFAELKLN